MKFPPSIKNLLSLAGVVLASISLFIIIFLVIISVVFDQGSSYLGLFTYIIMPVFLVIGLLLIPIGMLRKIRKDKKHNKVDTVSFPVINFNVKQHRKVAVVFVSITLVFLLISSVGSYEAFHYTESVQFCGTLCHSVMEPEYVAYQNSSHARVSCVTCHVGPGADWYVRSKLSGLYQVYAVTFNDYPKPIPTPITNLRPARETCEQCHWPEKFYGQQLAIKKHYLADETNSEWDIHLKIKTGPQLSALGLNEGIHWHINPDVKIEYIAQTDQRDTIPWVRYTNLKTNEVIVYEDSENPLENPEERMKDIRTMDCMDCHNRPSHLYHDPADFVDDALASGRIADDLPDIKSLSMQVLYPVYPATDSAMVHIANDVMFYYDVMYPEVLESRKADIEQAIEVLQAEFKKNIFPEMKVRWDVYPNHLGHLENIGCARCHNDRHQSATGKVISRDCKLCHEISAQGSPDSLQVANALGGLDFKHPIDINQKWKKVLCSECHNKLY